MRPSPTKIVIVPIDKDGNPEVLPSVSAAKFASQGPDRTTNVVSGVPTVVYTVTQTATVTSRQTVTTRETVTLIITQAV
ncbi:hypothetical protein NLG97_g11132 [Lecanicillium saksenae]|uniref:Uncharacterized protein n=1 Tax=Lecanicillium saksenae TaxID=468837 RepID=A0ACC1QBE2_9HYPO|nr:hypothetical protein NLG97_g11132 [Lecanicillium saksenae]